jgi:undecaprenyl-diphosphatase
VTVKNQHFPHYLQNTALLCGLFVAFVLFIVMAILSNISAITTQEIAWLWFIRESHSPLFTNLSIGLAWLGGLPVVLAFCVILCGIKLYQKQFVLVAFNSVTLLGAVALGWLFKEMFDRARPDIWPAIVNHFGASFPSNHSVYAVVVASIFILNLPSKNSKIMGISVVLWCLMMGISRVYLGVHYFTDVLAGWALGIAWVCSVLLFFKILNLFPTSSSNQSGNTCKNHEVTL